MTENNPVTMILAWLAAASTPAAPAETRAFYAANARESIRRLKLDLRDLEGKLVLIEAELIAASRREVLAAKRMVGKERAG